MTLETKNMLELVLEIGDGKSRGEALDDMTSFIHDMVLLSDMEGELMPGMACPKCSSKDITERAPKKLSGTMANIVEIVVHCTRCGADSTEQYKFNGVVR